MIPEAQTPSRSGRRWLRFGLRTLLVFATLACLLFAWVARERRQSAWEMEIAQTLEARGCSVAIGGPYDTCDGPTGPTAGNQTWWQRGGQRILGSRVYGVWVPGDPNVRDVRPLLEKLPKLNCLHVHHASMSDLAPLANLRTIRKLGLYRFKGDDFRTLAQLSQLTHLYLHCKNAPDLAPLVALQKLERLDIIKRKVTKAEMDELRRALPRCEINE